MAAKKAAMAAMAAATRGSTYTQSLLKWSYGRAHPASSHPTSGGSGETTDEDDESDNIVPALSGVYKGLSGVRPDGTAVFDFSQHRSVSELCPMNPNWVDSGGNLGGPTSGGLAGSSSGGSAGGSASADDVGLTACHVQAN